MTKFLQDLLTNDDPLFPFAMNQLEKSVGQEGVDVRLIADITHAAHDVMRALRLDPADTTARELYLALNAYSRQSDTLELLFATDFVLMRLQDGVVSFNLVDVIENAHHELPFEKRVVAHGQRALRGEIVQRYLDHPRTDAAATKQLALDAKLLIAGDDEHPKLIQEHSKQAGDTTVTEPYVLAVGDIFTDAFIQLDEQYAKVMTDEDGSKWLALPYGSKPPYDHADLVKSVGPSPNSAVSFARIGGIRSGLLSWLGDDQAGKESLAHLESEQVDTSLMVSQEGSASSIWYVLRYKADRTMLVKSEKYDYHFTPPADTPDWIYLSYSGKDSWPMHEELLAYLAEHKEVKLAFQPGSYHFEWGVEKLKEVYGRSHILVLNREEAMQITGLGHEDVRALANGLHELGPEKVVITDGPNGSYASYDFKLVTIPNYPDSAPPLDRTGAGDAFASTIVAALALGEDMDTALTWAPINSASVVQKIGAQAGLIRRDELEKYLSEAPDWYKVSEYKG